MLQEVPREYADIITQCWHDDPSARPEFSELLRPLVELHDILSPGGSGIAGARLSMSAASLASTVGSGGSAGEYCPLW